MCWCLCYQKRKWLEVVKIGSFPKSAPTCTFRICVSYTSQKECRTQSLAVTHLGFLSVSWRNVVQHSLSFPQCCFDIGVTLYNGFPMRVKCFVVKKKKNSNQNVYVIGQDKDLKVVQKWGGLSRTFAVWVIQKEPFWHLRRHSPGYDTNGWLQSPPPIDISIMGWIRYPIPARAVTPENCGHWHSRWTLRKLCHRRSAFQTVPTRAH